MEKKTVHLYIQSIDYVRICISYISLILQQLCRIYL